MTDLRNLSTVNAFSEEVGQCIYCRKPNIINLGREHVIPLSLGGGVILRKASCPFHSKMTRHFETEVAHDMLKPFRTIRGLNSRREKPTHFMATLERGDSSEEVSVPVDNHPDFLPVVAFKNKPGAFTGAAPAVPEAEFRIYHNKEVNARRIIGLPAGTFNFKGKIPFLSYLRLTAKIAHGLAVAHYGLGFQPFLLDIIEGRISDASTFIGAAHRDFPRPSNANTHILGRELLVWGDITFIVAVVGLFAGNGAPIHSAIAGCFQTNNPPSPPWATAANSAASAQ